MFFRFDQETLSKGASKQVVAHRLANGFWRTTEYHHTSGEFVGRAQICFDGGGDGDSRHLGPYEKVWIAGGAIYGDGKVVALFQDHSLRWISMADRTDWPAVMVEAA